MPEAAPEAGLRRAGVIREAKADGLSAAVLVVAAGIATTALLALWLGRISAARASVRCPCLCVLPPDRRNRQANPAAADDRDRPPSISCRLAPSRRPQRLRGPLPTTHTSRLPPRGPRDRGRASRSVGGQLRNRRR